MFDYDRCHNLIGKISSELGAAHTALLREFPIPKYIDCLDNYPPLTSHTFVSRDIKNLCAEIVANRGERTLESYHRLVLLNLILRARERLKIKRLTDEIREIYEINFERIVGQIESDGEPPGFYQYSEDGFRKDLALCGLVLIPVGGRKLDLAHFPLKILYTGGRRGFGQCLRMIRSDFGSLGRKISIRDFYSEPIRILRDFNALVHLPFELAGFLPMYDVHIDPHDPHMMSRRGYDSVVRTFIRVAELLKINKHIGGIFGTSWINDPEVEKISPRHNYKAEIWLENGARLFYVGPTDYATKMAIMKSPTRRKLYQEGKYIPRDYMKIWPRKQLIEWADSQKSISPEQQT